MSQTLRSIFPRLSAEEQADLLRTITELKIEAAEREADAIKDPMIRHFAQGFSALDRVDAGLPPKPKQITNEPTDQNHS